MQKEIYILGDDKSIGFILREILFEEGYRVCLPNSVRIQTSITGRDARLAIDGCSVAGWQWNGALRGTKGFHDISCADFDDVSGLAYA